MEFKVKGNGWTLTANLEGTENDPTPRIEIEMHNGGGFINTVVLRDVDWLDLHNLSDTLKHAADTLEGLW